MTDKLYQAQTEKVLDQIWKDLDMKRRKRRRVRLKRAAVAAASLLFFTFLFCIWGNSRFEVTFYQVETGKFVDSIRIVGITDLHNAQFGIDNKGLIDRIAALEPDLVLIAGDMIIFGDEDIDPAVSLCRKLTGIAPTFYSYGNHENKMVYGSDLTPEFLKQQAEKMGMRNESDLDFADIPMIDESLPKALSEAGVVLLNNNTDSIQIKGRTVDLAGINQESGAYYPYSNQMMNEFLLKNTENLKIIIAHRPTMETVIASQEWLQYDLLFCGHTHGGLIRIPGLGGMFRSGSIWPLFAGMDAGMHGNEQGTMILGRGLGNSNFVPRIFNLPELIVADIY